MPRVMTNPARPQAPQRARERSGTPRVRRIERQDGIAILKRPRPAHGAWRYAVMRVAARISGMQTLLPVPAHGGAHAQAIEVRRLRELGAAGVRVPAVLDESAEGIVLQFVGDRELVAQFKLDATSGFAAWQRGLDAIADVHARGQYLSQAFARNMLLHDGRIWFIDFEDDPLETMSLVQAQARDWLAYLHSSIWLLAAPRAALLDAWAATMREMSEPVAHTLRDEMRRLFWLRHLPARRRPWGRDVLSLQALAAFLYAWSNETRSTEGA